MFSPLLGLIAIHLGRWFPRLRIKGRSATLTWPLLAGLVVIAFGLLYRFKWSYSASNLLIGLILAVAFGAALDWRQWRSHFSWSWLAGAALTLVLAVMCRQRGCPPPFHRSGGLATGPRVVALVHLPLAGLHVSLSPPNHLEFL